MPKKVAMPQPRPVAATPDDFVSRKPEPEAPTEATKRLSVDVPVSLHKRLKIVCANREINMADAMRDFIAEGVRALERDVAEAA
jgi:hypothetical protein